MIETHSVSARFARFVTGRPWLSLAVSALALAGLTAGLPRVRANFTHTAFFYPDDPLMVEFDAFERRFGNDDAVLVTVRSESGVFDADTITLLQKLTERMWQVPEVIRVDSLTNFNWVHADGDDIAVDPLIPADAELTSEYLAERRAIALAHESLPDWMVSRDGKTAVVMARIRPGIEDAPKASVIVLAVREVVAALQGGDHVMHIHGSPAVTYAFEESTQIDLQKIIPLVLGLTILFLAVLLRSVSGVVLPLVVVVLSIVAALSVAGWTGVELSSVTSILPQILIAVGVADAVHILVGFRAARRNGLDKRAAANHTLSKNFVPTLLTSLTTALGFFAFSTAGLRPVAGLGLLSGIATLLAWLITYMVVGALLVVVPSWIKPRVERVDLQVASPRAHAYVGWLMRTRWVIVGLFAALTAAAAVLAVRTRVNSDPYRYFAEGFPLREANEAILRDLGYSMGYEIVLDSGAEDGVKDPAFMAKVEALERFAMGLPRTVRVVSTADVLRQMNRALEGGGAEAYRMPDTREGIAQELFLYSMSLPPGMDMNDRITVKNDAIRMSVLSGTSDSSTWMKQAHAMEGHARELGLRASVTGKGRLFQSMNDYVVMSFIQSLIIAVVGISIILVLTFRSVKLGLVAMIPNVVPLVIGGAVLNVLGANLDIGTVLVSSVCLGIAVDDTIHVLANYNRYVREGRSPREALALVFSHTGPALITTTLVLVSAFGAFGIGTFVPNVFFGIMTATVLTAALVTDLVLLPALLLVMAGSPEAAPASSLPAQVQVAHDGA